MGHTVAPGIEKLGRRHYRLWWVEASPKKRRSRVVHCELPEAKRVRAGIIDSQTRGAYLVAADITVSEWFDTWISKRRVMGNARAATLSRYRSLLDSFAARLGSMRLQDLTKRDIEGYYEWCLGNEVTRLGRLVSPETVHKRHKVLKQALDDACDQVPPIITINPAAKAAHPTPKAPDAQWFERDEASMLLGALQDTRLERPAQLSLYTGLRLGEVLGMRWRHVALGVEGGGSVAVFSQAIETNAGVSVVPYAKTASSRGVVSFGSTTGDMLRCHRVEQDARREFLGEAWEDGDLVFCGGHGQPMRPSKVSYAVSSAVAMLEDAGALSTRGATFHSLRHTHATLLLRERVPVHIVSKRLRHKTIQITLDYYAHVIPMDDAAAAAGFDATMDVPFGTET